MNRTRIFAPMLGLTALSAAALLPAPAHAQTTYTVTDLNPASSRATVALANFGNIQVGYGTPSSNSSTTHALVWNGTAASVVDFNPAGYSSSYATGINGNVPIGFGIPGNDSDFHALLWPDSTPQSAVDLNPAGFSSSQGSGLFGNTEVGFGYRATDSIHAHALLWHGTAASVVDINPAGFADSSASGVYNHTQVGSGRFHDTSNGGYISHALLWHDTAGSVVDLHPAGFTGSSASGVDADTQVGTGIISDGEFGASYALLWHGTADSVVNLTPGNDPDVNPFGEALAVSGNTQVGAGDINGVKHALAWHGTASSQVDLNAFLPNGYNYESVATGINADGDIVGYGSGSAGLHAFLWHAVFAPVLTDIDPATRTAGRGGFIMRVIGSSFQRSSVLLWNGKAQVTGFVNSNKLTVNIPGSLIAHAGTAQVTVSTPDFGVTNARTVTIMARPTITSLSPASKPAGAAAFTLTVTGTGFRPASFYAPSVVKWNGAALATTYVSSTKLTAQVPAALLTKSGTATVTVTTPQVATSAGKAFTVTP